MSHLYFISFVLFVSVTSGERRWCKVSNTSSSPAGDGWIYYEDTIKTCVTCSRTSVTLIDVEEVDLYECCNGNLAPAGSCLPILKESGANCSNALKCDGKKQCAKGEDEGGCAECSGNDFFACQDSHQLDDPTARACLPPSKVCDSKKDCRLGLDETGCKWHQGWCEGFLCSASKDKCIPNSQVCDGVKQCIDGSDENNCEFCENQFRCMLIVRDNDDTAPRNTRTAQCIGTFRVCNGVRDCDNGLDETNCFRWTEWSLWSSCPDGQNCIRNRSRTCVDVDLMEVDPVNCIVDVDDPKNGTVSPQYEYETTQSPIVTSSSLTLPMTSAPSTENEEQANINRSTIITTSTQSVPTGTTLASNTTDVMGHHVTSAATQGVPVRQSSNTILVIIIVVSIVVGVLLLLLLFCCVFFLTDRRRKTGFWKPKKARNEKPVKVPKMYYDIPQGDANMRKSLPTSQLTTESPVMSSFYGTLRSTQHGADSGIDDARSTSSSEIESPAFQKATNTNMLNDDFAGKRNLSCGPMLSINDEFPPPPPSFAA